MEQTKGILTPRDIDAGNVVRLKNGVYATQEGLANTMVDVERIVPGGGFVFIQLGSIMA